MYAEYLMSGLPFIFLSEQWQDTVAAEHGELLRTSPSGPSISGLTVPVPTRAITRRMLYAHPDLHDDATTAADIPASRAPVDSALPHLGTRAHRVTGRAGASSG